MHTDLWNGKLLSPCKSSKSFAITQCNTRVNHCVSYLYNMMNVDADLINERQIKAAVGTDPDCCIRFICILIRHENGCLIRLVKCSVIIVHERITF